MIDAVTFHCDLVGQLPVEITAMILQYLPLHQVFQAQRVSRKWRIILSSAQMVDNLLHAWYPGPSAPLSIPDHLSESAVASIKAEHVDAYRTGNPFSMRFHESKCFRVAYAE